MRSHHARHRAFVGDGQGAVTERMRPLHQFLRLRGTALEAEVGEAVQFGVVGGAWSS